jgi:hypothetical protein
MVFLKPHPANGCNFFISFGHVGILCYDSGCMNRRRLVYYLLLNVFISACVTGLILFWYDRTYRAVSSSSAQPVARSSRGAEPASTPGLQTDIPIKITSVIGAGTLDAEVAIVKFDGEGQLNLTGWQLKDSNGNTFTFPQITLYPNGAVQVHTSSGTGTVIDLYWNMSEPVWQSGEDAKLYDAQGSLRAIYRVP